MFSTVHILRIVWPDWTETLEVWELLKDAKARMLSLAYCKGFLTPNLDYPCALKALECADVTVRISKHEVKQA